MICKSENGALIIKMSRIAVEM